MAKRKRVNPYRRPMRQMTEGDLEKLKRDAVAIAIDRAWAIFISVLRDEFGFENEKLHRAWKAAESVSDSIVKGYIDVEDLMKSIHEEAGIVLNGSKYQLNLKEEGCLNGKRKCEKVF